MSLFPFCGTQQRGKRKRAVPVSLQAINIKTAVLGVILIHHVTSGFHSPSPVTPHSLKYRVRYSSHTNQHYPPQLCAGRTRTIVQVSTENRTVDVLTRAELQKLTVKELKERIKDLNSDVKISHLKLKKDLVDYLVAYNDETSEHEKVSSSLELNEPVSNPPNVDLLVPSSRSQRKKVLKMPPLTGKHEILAENNSQSSNSPKDVLFEQVFSRYPPLRQFNEDTEAKEKVILEGKDEVNAYEKYTHSSSLNPFTGLGDLDIRQQHHPMLANLKTSDLDIITVGTASCVPGVTRGVSCTALRLQWRRSANLKKNQGKDDGMVTGGIWVFDCGESTQLQVQRTGSVKPGKITKIFITHAHGDHSFGLPGLLCIMGQDRDRNSPPVEIYGPEGLRMWLRTAIRYSVSRIVPPYRVHELMDIPMAPEWSQGKYKNGRYFYQPDKRYQNGTWGTQGLAGEDPVSWISRSPMIMLDPSPQFGEIKGGRDIYPIYHHEKCVGGAPIWEVEDEGDVKVYAAPMSHGVPCVGYVVEEIDKPGRLRNDLVEPIARRNYDGLKKAGMRIPMKVMATIKDLPEGGSYTFPDGTTVYQNEVVESPRNGRKVVVCGDTSDARALAGVAKGADVLIHESTNAFLSGIDKEGSKKTAALDAKIHGHSTPVCAGEFAKMIGAKRLVLNHFSSRYKGDQSLESISIMTRIEQQAIKSSGLEEDMVAAAWDFMVLPVPQN